MAVQYVPVMLVVELSIKLVPFNPALIVVEVVGFSLAIVVLESLLVVVGLSEFSLFEFDTALLVAEVVGFSLAVVIL